MRGMRTRVLPLAAAAAIVLTPLAILHAQRQRLNPLIDLLEQKKPLFGVYWPSNASGRGRGGCAAAAAAPAKSPAELAHDALAYTSADFLFNGSMEGGVDRAIGSVADFVKATADAGALTKTPAPRLPHPLIVKTPKIAPDTGAAVREHQPRAEPRRQRHHVRRGRERRRSARRPRRDALQVEGRHAARRRRHGAGLLGHEREGL